MVNENLDKYNWIIVTEETLYNDIFRVMFSDCLNLGNVNLCDTYFVDKGKKNRLERFFYRKSIDRYIGRVIDLAINPQYRLNGFLSTKKMNIVVFMNGSFLKIYNKRRLNKLKKRFPKTIFVLLLVDAAFQLQAIDAVKNKDQFDYIYTFDMADSRRYGFRFVNTPYSKIFDCETGTGVYFCGSEKGRIETLTEFATAFKESDIPFTFDVFGNPDKSNEMVKIKNQGYKPYSNIVSNTLNYNCILDIVQHGRKSDSGLSLRVYEALVYNKVLITNNSNILDFKEYNSEFMHYVTTATDIKKEWISQQADYQYDGRFSPVHFFRDIMKQIGIDDESERKEVKL